LAPNFPQPEIEKKNEGGIVTDLSISGRDIPTVTLAGRQWPVPELTIRQLRACRRAIIDLSEALSPVVEKGDSGEARVVTTTGERVMHLPAEQFDQMCNVVYHGLTRAHPSLTPQEFDALEATDSEIFLAFLVVRRQSGIFVETRSAAGVTENSPNEKKESPTPIGIA
jgi:hypothetical protein